MKNSIIYYPRIGANKELKFAVEKYFKNQSSKEELLKSTKDLRIRHWQEIQKAGIDFIHSNDFSFYDNVLDATVLFNIVHTKYKNLNLESLESTSIKVAVIKEKMKMLQL